MGPTVSWPQLEMPSISWPPTDCGSPLLLASISETAARGGPHSPAINMQHGTSSFPQQPSASPKASFTKVPSSLLEGSSVEAACILQDGGMTFVYRRRHASRILHLPSEAALRLVEAVQFGVMTVQMGVLSSPPARHIQQLHSSLLAASPQLHQDGLGPAMQGRGAALLHALRLPRFLHRNRGVDDKSKLVEQVDDPKKAAAQLHKEGLHHERAMDLAAAARCYEQASLLDPTNAEWLCRWSKQLSDLTYAPGTSEQQARECNVEALKLAEQALALAPDYCLGYIASCISKGRLALFSDNRTKVTLAKCAQEDAATALRLDPKDDLAHHLIGRWHYEMAGQNMFVRTLVKILFGADLPPGTYHEALEAFQAAAGLRPDRVIHWVEMGRAEVKLGRPQDAIEHLRLALELDQEDINAFQEKEIGQELLQQLEREAARGLPRW